MSLVKCPECSSMISDKALLCPSCGAPTAADSGLHCQSCKAPVSSNDNFCANCGNSLNEVEEEIPANRRRLSFYVIMTAIVLIIIIVSAVAIKKIDRPVDAATARKDSTVAAAEEAEYEMVKTAREKKNVQVYTEKTNPKKYLKNEYSSKNNLLGETIVEGSLLSSATQVTYSGIKLAVTFLSKKGEELGRDEILLTDTIAPGALLDYRKKLSGPRGSREVNVELLSAKGK